MQVFNEVEFVAVPSGEEGPEELDILRRTSKEQGVLALEVRMIGNLKQDAFDGKRNALPTRPASAQVTMAVKWRYRTLPTGYGTLRVSFR